MKQADWLFNLPLLGNFFVGRIELLFKMNILKLNLLTCICWILFQIQICGSLKRAARVRIVFDGVLKHPSWTDLRIC